MSRHSDTEPPIDIRLPLATYLDLIRSGALAGGQYQILRLNLPRLESDDPKLAQARAEYRRAKEQLKKIEHEIRHKSP